VNRSIAVGAVTALASFGCGRVNGDQTGTSIIPQPEAGAMIDAARSEGTVTIEFTVTPPGAYCLRQCADPVPIYIADSSGTLNWDGSYYFQSVCGTGTECFGSTFAKPGKYTATFCATPGTADPTSATGCDASGPDKCATVDFDFPSSGTVTGTVGP
jgi:hypothetical protein